MTATLPAPLPGTCLEIETLTAGRVAFYLAGEPSSRAPMLLVHTINASGSAAEVRPAYEHAARHGVACALDLPGFGRSERSERAYTPRLMTDAVLAVAEALAQRYPGRVDGFAASLGCEYLARAAAEAPSVFGALCLVSPTGLEGPRREKAPGTTRAVPGLQGVLSFKPWSQALFNNLTRPSVIRYFLERSWGSKQIDETLYQYDLLTTREPGARFAPLAFLGATLFSADITRVYEALTQPVWVAHGVRGDFVRFPAAHALKQSRGWEVESFEAGALPYFEVPTEFFAAEDAFLARARART